MGLKLKLTPVQAARFKDMVKNLRKSGRFPMDPKKVIEIKDTMAEYPDVSDYRHALNMGISENTIRKVRAGGFDQ